MPLSQALIDIFRNPNHGGSTWPLWAVGVTLRIDVWRTLPLDVLHCLIMVMLPDFCCCFFYFLQVMSILSLQEQKPQKEQEAEVIPDKKEDDTFSDDISRRAQILWIRSVRRLRTQVRPSQINASFHCLAFACYLARLRLCYHARNHNFYLHFTPLSSQ